MPLINHGIGLVKMAELCGLKRRFFGLESKHSLAKRVVNKLREQSPITQLSDGLRKALEPRVCVREEHIVHHGGGQMQNEWVYHYSDGVEESILGPWV